MHADRQSSTKDRPADSERPQLSIVIPAYNEAGEIPRLIAALRSWANARPERIEVLLVDDGSRDGTIPAIRATLCVSNADIYAERHLTIRTLRLPRNHGKGHAVRIGVLASHGNTVLICDADLSTSLGHYDDLLSHLNPPCGVVIGSRDMPDSLLDPPQPFLRRRLAWTFRNFRRRLLLPDLRDTQCGFKLLSRAAADAVFAELREAGWLFDLEMLALARKHGFEIREVGVAWRNRRQSRVRLWRDVPAAIAALVRIRLRHGRG